ncbi:MAG: T9SS type A sorting domain-containing protein [Saprospiraceae bacterium]|nr:T9SS type A sorting domain-containing protein [Saprospiraceae bacterium]
MKRSLLLFSFIAIFAVSMQAQTVYWEEQFDGGIPSDWEIGPGSPEGAVWQWSPDGQANVADLDGVSTDALFWGTRGPIQSPSAANGCAMYNSDVYDGGGVGVGGGPFAGTHSGTLTSPSIDLTDAPTVSIKMNQYARANANAVSTLLEVSNDGGMTWTDFPINPNVVGNGGTAPDDVLLVNITSVAGGQSDVKIRFTWNGRYYYWLIDDIQLIETPKNNLQLGDFFYPPASYAQPEGLVDTDTMAFEADVTNIGGEDQTDVTLIATVTDNADNAILYQDSVVLDILEVDSLRTLTIESTYAPELPQGSYNINYEVVTRTAEEDDFDPSDNFSNEEFIVTESLYSKDDGAGIGGLRPGTQADWTMGNYYLVSPLAEGLVASTATFGGGRNAADGTMDGAEATVFLYRVADDVAADFTGFDTNSDSESLTVVGFQSYTFPAGYANYDDAVADILDASTLMPGVELEPGGRYFLCIRYEGANNNIFHSVDGGINYFQISTVVNTTQWFLGGFGPEEAAVVRMNVTFPDQTDEIALPESALTLAPNPVSDILNVTVDLEQPQDAMFIIANIEGKVMSIQEFQNVENQNFQFDVNNYPAGTYVVRISTLEGTKTKKFVVIK